MEPPPKSTFLGRVGIIIFVLFLLGFAVAFLGAGVLVTGIGIRDLWRGEFARGGPLLVFGVAWSSFCVLFIRSARRQKQEALPPSLAPWAPSGTCGNPSSSRTGTAGTAGFWGGILASLVFAGAGLGILFLRTFGDGLDQEGRQIAFWLGWGFFLFGSLLTGSAIYSRIRARE